jgi:hypothetical protein
LACYIIMLFARLYVRVGMLYNNAVRPVICEGWHAI